MGSAKDARPKKPALLAGFFGIIGAKKRLLILQMKKA